MQPARVEAAKARHDGGARREYSTLIIRIIERTSLFVHKLALAIALLAGLIGSQGPEFAQQYRQRLGGAIDELNRIVANFDAEAQRENLTPAEGLSRLDQNADPLARRARRGYGGDDRSRQSS